MLVHQRVYVKYPSLGATRNSNPMGEAKLWLKLSNLALTGMMLKVHFERFQDRGEKSVSLENHATIGGFFKRATHVVPLCCGRPF